MLECIRQLVDVDKDWVPDNPKASLYIRPTMIGTEPSLGVSVSLFCTLQVGVPSGILSLKPVFRYSYKRRFYQISFWGPTLKNDTVL